MARFWPYDHLLRGYDPEIRGRLSRGSRIRPLVRRAARAGRPLDGSRAYTPDPQPGPSPQTNIRNRAPLGPYSGAMPRAPHVRTNPQMLNPGPHPKRMDPARTPPIPTPSSHPKQTNKQTNARPETRNLRARTPPIPTLDPHPKQTNKQTLDSNPETWDPGPARRSRDWQTRNPLLLKLTEVPLLL